MSTYAIVATIVFGVFVIREVRFITYKGAVIRNLTDIYGLGVTESSRMANSHRNDIKQAKKLDYSPEAVAKHIYAKSALDDVTNLFN